MSFLIALVFCLRSKSLFCNQWPQHISISVKTALESSEHQAEGTHKLTQRIWAPHTEHVWLKLKASSQWEKNIGIRVGGGKEVERGWLAFEISRLSATEDFSRRGQWKGDDSFFEKSPL